MDEQGIDACIMLPTLGVGMETALESDPEALLAAFRAFNRWLQDDWGFNHEGRIYGAPYITLVDVDHAVDGARVRDRARRRRRAHAPRSRVRASSAGARPPIPRTTRSGPG